MTNTPQLDSEELRAAIERCLPDIPTHARPYAVDAIMQLIQADRAAFADRVLAVVPEKEHLQDNPDNLPWIDQWNNIRKSHNAIIDKCRTAITNLVAEGRGEKKG